MVKTFEVHRENLLPATPAQVWATVVTGPGNLRWLYPMEIEPRVGGVVSRGPSTVTVWEPPRHFALRHESEGNLVILEYRIEAHGDGHSLLRTHLHREHTGIEGEAWDSLIDCVEKFTDFYHHTLEQSLRYFPESAVNYFVFTGPDTAAGADAMIKLKAGLGLAEDVAAGAVVQLALPGLEAQAVTVDYADRYFLGLRTGDGLYRFFGRNHWQVPVNLSLHLFAEGIDREQTEQTWQAWLDGVFAA